jgi:hypothetical protein
MKNSLTRCFALVLVLGLVLVGGTALAEEATPEQGEAVSVTQTLNAEETDSGVCPLATDLDSIFTNWPGECPTGIPGCYLDAQCDSYCGGPGFGWCAPNLCCGCNA